ncbi:transmembrane and ubiquitin-like domain-containing protein 2 [Polypterus senegalus]
MERAIMTFVEGVGDEVTIAGGVLLLGLALVLAWFSTYVADRGEHLLGSGPHSSLVGLGGTDRYVGGALPAELVEAQANAPSLADKPEDEEVVNGSPEQTPSEGTPEASAVDQLFDIQGLRKSGALDGHLQPTASHPPAESGSFKIRLKFLNDTEEVAAVKPEDTVGLLKSKYFSGQEQKVKFIYQGQLLQDHSRTLLSLNITENCVIHCHLSQRPLESASEMPVLTDQGAPGTNVGNLMIPLFIVMLAVVWYFRINYRQFFTAPATVSLVGVTVFFSFLIFGMYGR